MTWCVWYNIIILIINIYVCADGDRSNAMVNGLDCMMEVVGRVLDERRFLDSVPIGPGVPIIDLPKESDEVTVNNMDIHDTIPPMSPYAQSDYHPGPVTVTVAGSPTKYFNFQSTAAAAHTPSDISATVPLHANSNHNATQSLSTTTDNNNNHVLVHTVSVNENQIQCVNTSSNSAAIATVVESSVSKCESQPAPVIAGQSSVPDAVVPLVGTVTSSSRVAVPRQPQPVSDTVSRRVKASRNPFNVVVTSPKQQLVYGDSLSLSFIYKVKVVDKHCRSYNNKYVALKMLNNIPSPTEFDSIQYELAVYKALYRRFEPASDAGGMAMVWRQIRELVGKTSSSGGLLFKWYDFVLSDTLRTTITGSQSHLVQDTYADAAATLSYLQLHPNYLMDSIIRPLYLIHTVEWLHRDVKPGNYLVNLRRGNPPRIVLSDLGSCRPQKAKATSPCTQEYRAPALWANETNASVSTDLFGAAVTIVEILLGHRIQLHKTHAIDKEKKEEKKAPAGTHRSKRLVVSAQKVILKEAICTHQYIPWSKLQTRKSYCSHLVPFLKLVASHVEQPAPGPSTTGSSTNSTQDQQNPIQLPPKISTSAYHALEWIQEHDKTCKGRGSA